MLQIEIPDLFPATVKSLLDYIYSGKFDTDSDEDLFRLLSAADKYGLISLRQGYYIYRSADLV